ncbi:MAG: mucoidy inhibitor MuiA family protein [Myxococcota bacterium]
MSGSIIEARVFIDRAILTRQQEVPSGATIAIFEPLPLGIDLKSLHARAVSHDGRELSVIGVRAVPVERLPGEAEQARDRQLQALDGELAQLHDQEQTALRSAGWLSSYVEIATQSLAHEWLEKSPAFDKWEAALDHLRQAFQARSEAEARRKRESERILERRAKLNKEAAAQGKNPQIGWRVEVELEAGPGEAVVQLYTTTFDARWMPIYDAQLSGERSLRLIAYAAVKNATQEAWDDVRLIATTARPKLSEPMPELMRMVVVSKGRGRRGLELGEEEVARLVGGASGPSAPEEAGDAVEHIAPGTVSVPAMAEAGSSSAHAFRVRLFEAELSAKLRLTMAPLERRVGTWVVRSANSSGKILLPGRAHVFRDGAYCGVSELGFVVPGQRFELPVGSDASIRVNRDVLRSPREHKVTAGAVLDRVANGSRGPDAEGRALGVGIEDFDWRLHLENPSPHPLEITVLDRIPVSRTGTVEVKLSRRPEGFMVEEETGLVRLDLELKPYEKKRLEARFTVTTPIGFSLPVPGRL